MVLESCCSPFWFNASGVLMDVLTYPDGQVHDGSQRGTFSAQLLKGHKHGVRDQARGRGGLDACFQWTCPRHPVVFSQPVFSAEPDAQEPLSDTDIFFPLVQIEGTYFRIILHRC